MRRVISRERLSEASIRTRLEDMHRTIACGLHSGIPPCCVAFYVRTWLWQSRGGAITRFADRYLRRLDRDPDRLWCGYIPCPGCLRALERGARPAKVRACPAGAECHHAAEQA